MMVLLTLAAAALAPDAKAARSHPAHRAQGNLAPYFSDDDYPPEAIRRGEQGITAFTLEVDEAGRVSACRVTRSSGSALLDEATCRLASVRARFAPARDRRGRAVPDRISSRMRWVLPEEDASRRARANLASYISDDDYPAEAISRGEEGTVGFLLSIGADGAVSGCEVQSSSGSEALDSATCRIMRERARFAPARDSSGRPIPDAVKARIRWVLPVDEAVTDPEGGIDFSNYLTGADYPAEALSRHEQGRVGVQLSVSVYGGVIQCLVTRSSGSAALDARTCEILRARARFEPTRDQNGTAIRAIYGGSVQWTLPAP